MGPFFSLLFIPVLALTSNSYSNSTVVVNGTHTSIRVESNGEVKTYESDTPGSVTVQTANGSATASGTAFVSTIAPPITPEITPPTFVKQISPPQLNLLDKIRIFFQNLFKFHFR
jgi:hypothetical protein